jgi:hypothetical protein
MIDTQLRAADPAANVDLAPTDRAARAMLAMIVSQPRRQRHRPSRRSVRRVIVGGVLAGAAATVAVAAPMPWDHGANLTSSASAVTVGRDGSVRIVLRWSQLKDPATLQAALNRAGAHTRILTGDSVVSSPAEIPACALPYSGRSYSSRAVEWDTPAANAVGGILIHPDQFPNGATFIIEAQYAPGTTDLMSTLSFMARGAVPTCAVPSVGPNPAAPPTG